MEASCLESVLVAGTQDLGILENDRIGDNFIDKYVKLQHQVDSLSLADVTGQWEVEVQNL